MMFYRFFCYPFFTLLYPGPQCVCPNSGSRSETRAPVTQDLGVELALEVYRSLFVDSFCGSKTAQVFLEGFYEYLVTVIDENMSLFQANLEHCSEKLQNVAILTLGEVLVGLLQNGQLLNADDQELNEPNEDYWMQTARPFNELHEDN
jgi:telomere-associated protein RIF1